MPGLRALRLDRLSLPDRRLPQVWAAARRALHWRKRLAGAKRAVALLLVPAPGLRVARERLLRAQLAHGRGGGEVLGREALWHKPQNGGT